MTVDTLQNKIKSVREVQFRSHKASMKDYGDIQIIDWSQPYTGISSYRYILDGKRLFISSGMGEAVCIFDSPISLGYLKNISVESFVANTRASSKDYIYFDAEKAQNRLREWERDLLYKGVKVDRQKIESVIDFMKKCESIEEWEKFLIDDFSDYASSIDDSNPHWMSQIGNNYSLQAVSCITGLHMCYEQLNNSSK